MNPARKPATDRAAATRRGFFGVIAGALALRSVKPPVRSRMWIEVARKNGKSRLQSEYLEARSFSVEEIVRIYDVPAHMIIVSRQ